MTSALPMRAAVPPFFAAIFFVLGSAFFADAFSAPSATGFVLLLVFALALVAPALTLGLLCACSATLLSPQKLHRQIRSLVRAIGARQSEPSELEAGKCSK